jgi:hypothetical protein
MCANKFNTDCAKLVGRRNNKAISVSLNIENNTVARNKVGAGVPILNVLRRFPVGLNGLAIPCLEGFFSVGMYLPELDEMFLCNDPRGANLIPKWDCLQVLAIYRSKFYKRGSG